MSDDPNRVNLNLRVDEDVKDAFNSEIERKYGKCRPYAGIELEREFRFFLDRGETAELNQVVDDLNDSIGGSDSKEKIRVSNRNKTTVASHRISENIRSELKSVAEDDYRSPGKLAESIMYRYVTDGSVVERLTQKLQNISKQMEYETDDSLGAKERRTKKIADELSRSGVRSFRMEEFDEAINSANGISVSDYTREQYLPRVLDQLDFTWHPENTDVFVDRDSVDIPKVRDPTKKPLILVDENDKQLMIKLAAYRAINDDVWKKEVFSTDDAVDLFKGHVRKSTVRPLMREIADTSPGYKYDREKEELKLTKKVIKRHADENQDILQIEEEPIIRG